MEVSCNLTYSMYIEFVLLLFKLSKLVSKLLTTQCIKMFVKFEYFIYMLKTYQSKH